MKVEGGPIIEFKPAFQPVRIVIEKMEELINLLNALAPSECQSREEYCRLMNLDSCSLEEWIQGFWHRLYAIKEQCDEQQ